MGQHPRISQTVLQDQKLVMSAAMKRAFHVLQMPMIELAEWVENELEQNPVLDAKLPKASYDFSQERSVETLYSYLEREIQFLFEEKKERELALFFAGSLNEKGFLTLTEEEICQCQRISSTLYHKVLKRFHEIEPIGLGAKDVQDCLLLQLTAQGKRKTRLYQIVDKYFGDLIHNRLDVIAKALRLSMKTIKTLIQKELRQLDPFPGRRFSVSAAQQIIPDLVIDKEDENWKVEVEGDLIPTFQIHPHYFACMQEKKLAREELDFIRRHLAAGKWLQRTLDRRKHILAEIGHYLLKRQRDFLEGIEAAPAPMTRRELAKALDLSESTVTRAIHHKHLACPIGVIPLRHFFSHAIQTESGEISKQKAKVLLQQLIHNENKADPLSDEALSSAMQGQGVPCARRTISKYRKELNIGARGTRKQWQ